MKRFIVVSLPTNEAALTLCASCEIQCTVQESNPNGTQSADGYYHPEDEVFLPWFMRLAPNDLSEPTQNPSTNIGRYSLMGDLNPFAGFRETATGCN